jgi:hypothetical protein
MTPRGQRLLAVVILGAAGVLSLPLAAFVLDGSEGGENLILPVQLVVMAAIGGGLGAALPALAPAGAATSRRVLVGIGWGLLGAVVGVALFWFLLNGIGGA